MTRAEFAAMSLRAVAANFRARNARCHSGDPGDRRHKSDRAARRMTIRMHIRNARIAQDLTKWDALPEQTRRRIYWMDT